MRCYHNVFHFDISVGLQDVIITCFTLTYVLVYEMLLCVQL